MADTIEKIIKIESSGSEQTVKGLKKEIDSLRDALLNVEKGGDEYKKILEQLIGDQKQLADVMSAGKNEISAATGSYNALKNEMSALKKVWAEVTDETSRSDIGRRIDEINTELKEMDASIGNFQRNVGNYASGFKNARQELAALKTQMDNLQEGSAEYAATFQRASEITHTLSERQEMLKYSSADLGTQLSNVAGIAAGLMGGFNAIQGVMALTGSKSEELEKTMMKLQAGIAIVQGLQGLEGMKNKAIGLVDGLTAMIFKTNETTAAIGTETVAVEGNTAAQESNIVATEGATLATKGFQKAIVATGIGALIVALGALIAHWDEFKDMVGLSNEKLEEFRGVMDKAKVVISGVANVIGNVLLVPIKNLITSVSTLGTVISDVFQGKFKEAVTDAKEGLAKIVQTTKDGYDIIGNYQEGADAQRERNAQKAAERENKRRKEELEDLIKDNEAKEGSDWKYSEEGKKAYEELFDKKLSLYKKDSKEYKDAQREKWAYERDYQKRISDAEEAAAEEEKRRREQAAREAKAAAEAAAREAEREKQEKEKERQKDIEAIKAFDKRAKDSAKEAKDRELDDLEEKYNTEKALLDKRKDDFENYQEILTDLTAEYEAKRDAIQKKYDDAEKQRKADNLKETSDKALGDLDYKNGRDLTNIELEYSWKEAQNGALSYDDIIEEHNKIYAANKEYLDNVANEYKKVMDSEDATDKQREEARRKYYETQDQLRDLNKQKEIQDMEDRRDRINAEIDMYKQLGESIADIFGSIADMMKDEIKREVEAGDISEEEGKRRFEAVKRLQIAQATIQMLAGIATALAGAFTTKTGPWDMVLAGAQAATIAASGIAQIVKIKNTQLGGSSSVSSSAAATPVQTAPEEYVPQYTQNATGESEITRLADSIHNQKVYVVESDITEAQNRSKVRVTESTW